MHWPNSLIILLTVVTLTFSGVFANQVFVHADSGFESVVYPIIELGSCQDKTACKKYCSDDSNADQCLEYAKARGLMSDQEISTAKKFLSGRLKGPGGCTSKESCEEYCNNISNINQCVTFVEQNNLLSVEELQEFKQVQSAINKGVTPPACKNKQDCELYCEAPEHMEECVQFGKEAGFLQGQELEEAQKMVQAIKNGAVPPPCRGRQACEQYCSEPANMEQCMDFAIQAGFMSGEEKEQAQKMLSALKKGVAPLQCKGKEDCQAYCSQDQNFEKCFNFAEQAGFITQEEAAIARKTGGKGPGGCKGKEECEAFCQSPSNQEICFAFAKEYGLINEEDAQHIEDSREEFRGQIQGMPPAVAECLQGKVGLELVEKMKQGFMPTQELGQQMQECFQKMSESRSNEQGHGEDFKPPENSFGGQGCQTPEECEKLRMMRQENMPPEMIPPQNWEQRPPGEFSPEQYQKPSVEAPHENYSGQYPERYQGEMQPPPEQYAPPEYHEPIPAGTEPKPAEPTSSITHQLLGALLNLALGLFYR